jgi:hypothetical protein
MRFIRAAAVFVAAAAGAYAALGSVADHPATPSRPIAAMAPAAACRYLHQGGGHGSFAAPSQAALAYAAAHIDRSPTGQTLLLVIRRLADDQAARRPADAALSLTILHTYCGFVIAGWAITGPGVTPPPVARAA